MNNLRITTRQRLLGLCCLALVLIAPTAARGDGGITFNGSGAGTSKLENTSANILNGASSMAFTAWVKAAGAGEGSGGIVMALDKSGQTYLTHTTSANTYIFHVDRTTTDGEWRFTATDGQWNCIQIAYDNSSDANHPEIYVNGVLQSAFVESYPDGDAVLSTSGYCVGNETSQGRTWNGQIAHVQIHNDNFGPTFLEQCRHTPGSVTNSLRLWLPMTNPGDTSDRSPNGFHGTATSLIAASSGPPVFTSPVGAPVGVAVLNSGTIPVTQYVIPRYADGTNHPAGTVRGHGPASAIQGSVYGPDDGDDPQVIVATEDYEQSGVKQWQNESGTYPAVLVPTFADFTIAGRDADGTGYIYHPNVTSYNSPIPPNPSTAPQTPAAVGTAGNEGVTFNNSTSKIRNSSANLLNGAQTVTVCCWVRARSWGEDGYGRIFYIGDGETVNDTAFRIYHKNDNHKLMIDKLAGGADMNNNLGQWEVAATDGYWNSLCVRLDFSGSSGPTVRINKRTATVNQLGTTPNGIGDAPGNTYTIGNNNAGSGTWFGQIAHMQVWNRILSDAEADDAIDDPGSVTSGLRLYLPMTSATDTSDESGLGFHPDVSGGKVDLATHAGFHERETGLGIRASGTRIKGVRHFNIAGPAAVIHRPNGTTGGQILPFDEEMVEIDDVSIYRCYAGYEIDALDTQLGSYEAEYLRDWGLKFVDLSGACKISGPVHISGVFSGRPDSQSPAVWFTDQAGACWGGPWYVETADIGMLIESSGNKLGPLYSHTCYYGNLWIGGSRNSISNFEIDVVDGVTEINGRAGIVLYGQECTLSNGTIGGGAHGAIPSGEIGIRLHNGTRQSLNDISFVGTDNSSAPLIRVQQPLRDSVIIARCRDAGTFLELYIVAAGTARGGTTNTIRLAANEYIASDLINDMTVTITGGTGSSPSQTRTIDDYDGVTGIATVDSAWTIIPGTDSTYEVRADMVGEGNFIRLSTDDITGAAINLGPDWGTNKVDEDEQKNDIRVDGIRYYYNYPEP